MPAMLRKLAQRLGVLQHSFAGGVHPEMYKVTAALPIEEAAITPVHILPMKQHIGEACSPLVRVGDRVLRGQKIAKSEGYLSVPVHAPTSGRVVKIEEHAIPHPSGMGMPSIFIESDGDDKRDESLDPLSGWREMNPATLRERARMCGLAGLGGAVFPTFIKLIQDKRFPIETVILNGIECEPWLTNDHRLMLEQPDEILSGLAIIMHMVGASSGIIAIEDNKPDAADVMREALARTPDMEGVRVVVLPTRYPQGSEKQLIYSLTGKEVPAGRLPMHIGVICQNVGTSRALHDAVVLGHPLTERLVTVSGDAVTNPANMRVRLGMPVRSLFASRGLDDLNGLHILHGGPMMGERLKSVDVPVIKSTTGLLAMRTETMMLAHTEEQPCIRCGHCSEACPIHLVPNLLADACRSDQFDRAENYQLFDCIECGSCSYVCPANIPLVHYFRYGKGQIAQQRREQVFAEASRKRSEARDARIARENAEKAARRQRVRREKAPVKPVESKGDINAGDEQNREEKS
ncbi:electron transport complex protein RnfC [Mariprofundus ferrinatatus]|uniref:Ion-translocating oxidoreductase complex subunit C n=1 Tax=Mariprofundus ferrinatatus TaxID=1921087 RepID=A0A2K8L5P1_9PROT|nr:electron transport complex subunit RsxC [Mariprofundus ferrinatatus]ATX82553.1 electron transport complex protein RnfC [Mariprofundus ferrinatatus]